MVNNINAKSKNKSSLYTKFINFNKKKKIGDS